jgi:hypothetical protein
MAQQGRARPWSQRQRLLQLAQRRRRRRQRFDSGALATLLGSGEDMATWAEWGAAFGTGEEWHCGIFGQGRGGPSRSEHSSYPVRGDGRTLPRQTNKDAARGSLAADRRASHVIIFWFKTNLKSDSSVEKIARQQVKIWENRESRKFNFEHISLLQFLSNLNGFWNNQKILNQI